MFPKPTTYCVVFLVAGLFASSGCSSSSNPAGPSANDTDSTVGRTGNISVTVNPNPVPFDGKPITDVAGCARRNNTWYYELTLKESGGAPVTFNAQIDAFDGFVVNNLTGIDLRIPANGEVKLHPRWCSATNSRHTAQHTFSGTDSNGNSINLQTPVINLMGK
jgi:hypothetical protein